MGGLVLVESGRGWTHGSGRRPSYSTGRSPTPVPWLLVAREWLQGRWCEYCRCIGVQEPDAYRRARRASTAIPSTPTKHEVCHWKRRLRMKCDW
jgi:hypothetical protein